MIDPNVVSQWVNNTFSIVNEDGTYKSDAEIQRFNDEWNALNPETKAAITAQANQKKAEAEARMPDDSSFGYNLIHRALPFAATMMTAGGVGPLGQYSPFGTGEASTLAPVTDAVIKPTGNTLTNLASSTNVVGGATDASYIQGALSQAIDQGMTLTEAQAALGSQGYTATQIAAATAGLTAATQGTLGSSGVSTVFNPGGTTNLVSTNPLGPTTVPVTTTTPVVTPPPPNPGDLTTAQWASLLSGLGGMYASNKYADTLERLANRSWEAGAPSRGRYEGSYAPGFSMANDPGFTDMMEQAGKSTMAGLSVGGNPYGRPSAVQSGMDTLASKYAYPALQNYRTMNAQTGALATLAGQANTLGGDAAKAEMGPWNVAGATLGDIYNPTKRVTGIDPVTGRFTYNV